MKEYEARCKTEIVEQLSQNIDNFPTAAAGVIADYVPYYADAIESPKTATRLLL